MEEGPAGVLNYCSSLLTALSSVQAAHNTPNDTLCPRINIALHV